MRERRERDEGRLPGGHCQGEAGEAVVSEVGGPRKKSRERRAEGPADPRTQNRPKGGERRAEVRGWRAKVGGPRSEGGGPRSEEPARLLPDQLAEEWRVEVERPRSEGGGPRLEGQGPRSEGGRAGEAPTRPASRTSAYFVIQDFFKQGY